MKISKQISAWMVSASLAMTASAQAMTTNGNQIINSNGNPVQLKGINWFGFNNNDTMVDGLWQTSSSIASDFQTIVYRMQLLGFNAVRLPFNFSNLLTEAPRVYTASCTRPTQSQIQASVTDPSVLVPGGDAIPPMTYSVTTTPGMCNNYFPNDTTWNRFLWVVNFFAKNGFYVLVDNHFREDQTVLQSPTTWVQDWVKLITAISQDPVSKKMLMIDILNEPDNFGLRWEASGTNPGVGDLYLSMMDAVYPINNDVLFFIEGTGQNGIGCNWGDGFCTDETLISQHGLSDPNPFFKALLAKPYVNQVVIEPHVYPPSVTGQGTAQATGTGLWTRMTESFGYLTKTGYSSGSGSNKLFPVVLGEFGSMFTQSTDLTSMSDIASYLNNTGAAADGKHTAIGNWLFWCWNANSGDTGGIVGDDWLTIHWPKVEYLTGLGLTPWYQNPQPGETGTLCVSVLPTTGLTSQELQPISAGGYSFPIAAFNTPVCETVNTGAYTVSAPQIIVGNTQFDAQNQTATVAKDGKSNVSMSYVATSISGNLTVAVQMSTPWQSSSGVYQNVINLQITNTGKNSVQVPWTLSLANSAYTAVTSSWNLTVNSIKSGTISATASQSWETLQANKGNTVNVGMIVSSTSSNFMPTTITINGIPCTIQH